MLSAAFASSKFFLKDICEFIQCGGAEASICEKATVANALSTPVPKGTFNRA